MKKSIFIALLIIPAAVSASLSVGKITALKGLADISKEGVAKPAQVGSDLFAHEQIVTKENAKVQVVFQDETIITIGKNSQFSIDEYTSSGAESDVKLSLFTGAMRAVTGKIGKANPQKFKVKTKTATIGIRGTNFVVIAMPDANDIVACTLGAITVQGSGGMLDVPNGYMTQIGAGGNVQKIEQFTSSQLGVILNDSLSVDDTATESETTEKAADEEQEVSEDETLSLQTSTSGSVPSSQNAAEAAVTDQAMNNVIDNYSALKPPVVIPLDYSGSVSNIYVSKTWIYPSYGLNYGVNTELQALVVDSAMVSDRSDIDSALPKLSLNSKPKRFVSAYNFETNFLPTTSTYTSSEGSVTYSVDTTRGSENYIRTITDIDENDEITWGEWSAPITTTAGADTYQETWSGHWVAGTKTPVSVIDGYRNGGKSATYNGSLIGASYENSLVTPFTGSVVSNVNFGSSAIKTALTYSVHGDSYEVATQGTIHGNSFDNYDLAATTSTIVATIATTKVNGAVNANITAETAGAFYTSEGKTLGGQFGIYHNGATETSDRIMSGAYQAKTEKIQ